MGGSNSTAATLPQIWQRINDSHLRHRTTHEIIQQHTLAFSSAHAQQYALTNLQHRIALHHPAVPRVIYFRQAQVEGLCSPLGGDYRIEMYSEYCGDCLERVAEEKGERSYHAPCQCGHILSAVLFLRDRYGSFLVTPRMVFLGSRRERASKVWIHSRVEESQPQLPSNEEQMCASINQLLQYMRSHRICVSVTSEQLQAASNIKQLSELKSYITAIHQIPPQIIARRKANSESTPPLKQDHTISQQQKIDRSRSINNHPIFSNNFHPKPPKILFSYRPQSNPGSVNLTINTQSQQGSVQLPRSRQIPEAQNNQIAKILDSQSEPQSPIANINAPTFHVNLDSRSISPESKEKLPNFTIREIELPLKEQEDKGTSSRLPTTSRSPKPIKEPACHPIEEMPQIIERRFTSTEGKPWRRKEKKVSLHSSGNKFEKYRDAIKNYEQKLRQKFANSTGSNPLTAKRKTDLVIRPPAAVPTKGKGDYKETESLYNNSADEEERQTSIAHRKEGFDGAEAPHTRPDEKRDLQQTNENSNDQELQNKRLREQLEKLQLQKDLQREKALIDSEMQDLLRQNGVKDEYRSIRDKIKQKKETFAQLKAEAAKILEDLDY